MLRRAADAQAALARHPRHLLLAALAAGLLAGPSSAVALAAATALVLVTVRETPLVFGTLAALLAGAAVGDARLAALDRSELAPGDVTARVTLLEHPRTRSFNTRVAAAQLRGERVLVKAPARVAWPRVVAPGIIVAIEGRLAALGPHDAHERRRGAHALLVATTIRATGARRGGLLGALDRVRDRSERALAGGLPAPQGALARGMVLGQDSALTDDVREDFRVTGLAHLVAASGANVMLLAALVLAAGAALGLGLSARLWLAIALIAAYVPLAGGGPSIQRAAVMGIAGIVAALAGRPSSRWYALLLAAAVTLAWNPRAAGDAGWQLSFAAVLAMLALVPGLRTRLAATRAPPALADALAVTAAATIGTAPLIALHFERLSLVSLPANLLAAPAVAPVMWLGTIAGALGQIAPALAAPVAALAALPLGYLTWLADAAAAPAFAEVVVPSPGAAGVLAIYAATAAALLAWRRLPRTARRATSGVLALGALGAVAALAAGHGPGHPPKDLTISFLDVGQGDATLIQHGDAAVLVDTGPPGGPVLERLRRAGVRRLDMLVATHDAADHDGATAAVLATMPVGLVLDGEEVTAGGEVRRLAAAHSVRRIASDAGQVIRAGPLQLRVLWPRREPAAPADAEPNDRATVLHVRDGDFDLLLTADAESNVLAGLHLPVVEALKVSHHGSDDPGLPGLLERLRPQVAAIEVGAHNSYGHPTPSTLAALQRAVPVVRRTDRDGTVRITVRDGRMHVSGEEGGG
ncbi:MAG: Late competence protein ComEC, DNA transport [uncultured Solirubrobacteraceae bacterium]|uniref:Late competence protein ComEC, DNA transport n=1 Tax=uncultured Solirubrobacteraceae bacterium TaxID=1162706 RepID=A0A6J4SNV7_9ACTN|nr:MAG: Late competence protein ComEC, DNA transport [uncultured Solirubrobacteraceae bacterium]